MSRIKKAPDVKPSNIINISDSAMSADRRLVLGTSTDASQTEIWVEGIAFPLCMKPDDLVQTWV